MSQSNQQEQTEAKLLAYIEGELDEAGRAEIERHLEAHPNHRRMLLDLSQGRDLVRFLPKASAPPELLETFQGQLERSALLGDSPVESTPGPMRIGAWDWSRIRSAAAVVLLAAGLGVVVYIALPGRQPAVVIDDKPVRPADGELRTEATGSPSTFGTEPEGIEEGGRSGDNRLAEADKAARADAAERLRAMTKSDDGAGGLSADVAPPATSTPPPTGPMVAKAASSDPAPAQPDGSLPGRPGEMRKSAAGKSDLGFTELAAGASAMDAIQVERLKRAEKSAMDVAYLSVAQNPAVQDVLQNGARSPYVSNAAPGNRGAVVSSKDSAADAPVSKQFTSGTGRAAGAAGGVADPNGAMPTGGTAANVPAAAPVTNAEPPYVVVVSAADPDQAQKQITDFLVSNAIAFDNVDRAAFQDGYAFRAPAAPFARGPASAAPAPTTPALQGAEAGPADAAQRAELMKSKMGAPAKPDAVALADEVQRRRNLAGGGGSGAGSERQNGQTAVGGAAAEKRAADRDSAKAESLAPSAGIAAVAPGARPAPQDARVAVPPSAQDDSAYAMAKAKSQPQSPGSAPADVTSQQMDQLRSSGEAKPPIRELIIARGMNRRQVDLLQSRSNRPADVQYATLYLRSPIAGEGPSGSLGRGAANDGMTLRQQEQVQQQEKRFAAAGEQTPPPMPAAPAARGMMRADPMARAGDKAPSDLAAADSPAVVAKPSATAPVTAALPSTPAAPRPTRALDGSRQAVPSEGPVAAVPPLTPPPGGAPAPAISPAAPAPATPQLKSAPPNAPSLARTAEPPVLSAASKPAASTNTPALPDADAVSPVPSRSAAGAEAAVAGNFGARLGSTDREAAVAPASAARRQRGASTGPTTAPIEEIAEALDDRPVDVVIVVQRAAVASEAPGTVATNPESATTQPAAVPPAASQAPDAAPLAK